MTLVCPECGVEFVAYGDVPMEFIVHEWAAETDEEGHHETPEGILRIFAHGHDPGAFLEKGSGLPFLSREISGMNIGANPGALGAGRRWWGLGTGSSAWSGRPRGEWCSSRKRTARLSASRKARCRSRS
jgi:hypothetical protein